MTKKILIVVLAMILCLSLVSLVACGNPCKNGHNFVDGVCTVCNEADPNYTPEPEQTLADIAKSGKAGNEYTFTAVVFATDANGFYVNDTYGSIYVVTDTNAKVGDEVVITGTLSLEGTGIKKPVITATTNSYVNATGKTALQPEYKTIEEVLGVTAARQNFYQFVTVAGFVTPVEGGYTLTVGEGSAKLNFAADSNATLANWENKQVDLTAIVTGYQSGWQLSVVAESIALHQTDLDLVKDAIFTWVDTVVEDEVYFALDLPTAYALEGNVQFAWEVVSGTTITIADNKATVNATAEELVELKLTLTAGDKTASQNYEVIVKAPATKTFAEVKAETGVFKISGTILTDSHSQGASRCSVVLFDENNNLIQVSVANTEELDALNKGDKLTVVGSWTEDAYGIGYFAGLEHFVSEPAAADYVTSLANFDVVTLATQADYEAFLNGWAQKASAGTIVKIVNPYVIYSGNTSYNFIRFGYNTAAGSKYSITVGEGETAQTFSRIFCFQRDAMEREYPGLDAGLQVPFLEAGNASQREIVVYAMPLYAGSDTLQFSIVDAALVELDKQAYVENAINGAFASKDLSAAEAGVLELPTTAPFVEGAITWVASNPDFFNVTTGEYQAATADFTLTLTASYTLAGEAKTYVVELNVITRARVPYTIAEAKTATAEDLAFNGIKGVIAAFGTDANNTTGSSYGGHYFFVYITNGTEVYSFYPQEWKATKGAATATINGVELKLYDEIVIANAAFDTTTPGARIITGDFSKVLSSGNKIDYTNLVVDTTITSEEEMNAWAAATAAPVGGLVLKFTGTFYMVGTGSTQGAGCRYQINFRDAAESKAAQYIFNLSDKANKTVALKACNGMLIDEWWTAAGLEQASGSQSFTVEGTIYVVTAQICGNTLWAVNLINADGFDLHPESAESKAAKEVAALGQEISAVEAGAFTLPTATATATAITWETVTTLEGLSIAEGVLSFPVAAVDTVVTLKATYTVGEATYTANVDFTLKAKVIPVTTVTETLALANETEVKVEGIVGAFVATTSGSDATKAQMGLVLTDGTNLIVTADLGDAYRNADLQYVVGGNLIAIGDKVQVTGVFSKAEAGETIAVTQVASIKEVVVVSTGNTVAWKAPETVVNNEAEMTAWAAQVAVGQMVKLVATAENPLYIQASGSKESGSLAGRQQSWGFHYKKEAGTGLSAIRYTVPGTANTSKAIAVKGMSSECTLGANWWAALVGEANAAGWSASSVAGNAHPLVGEITLVVTAFGGTNLGTVAIASTLAPYTAA